MAEELRDHYRRMARYNRLANERLYAACAELSEAELKRARPAFFRSIHGTLNHLLLGDRIWMTRFAGGEAPSTALDAILYQDFGELRAARQAEDERIEAHFDALDTHALERSIRYVNNQGRVFDDPMPVLIAHFFNHQTHHRGQVHDLLSQTAVAPPSLDLHRVLIPEPGAANLR